MLGFNTAGLIGFFFGVFNVLRLVSYLPQLIAVARDNSGAHAISLTSWTIWIGANATTALYAWMQLSDLTLAAVSAFNALCCLLVFFVAGYKRIVFTRIQFDSWPLTA